MFAYAIRRIVATIPVILIVAFFVFSLLYIAPGDPAAVIAGDQATPQDVERIRESLGLDRPFLVRFADWLFHVIRGDLGQSIFTNLPVPVFRQIGAITGLPEDMGALPDELTVMVRFELLPSARQTMAVAFEEAMTFTAFLSATDDQGEAILWSFANYSTESVASG